MRAKGVLLLTLVALCLALPILGSADDGDVSCGVGIHPVWRFIGRGFHMQLALDFSLKADSMDISFDLPRAFFLDAAEAEQQYFIEEVRRDIGEIASNTESEERIDRTSYYAPLEIKSQYFFDIEAPVFRINYTNNAVVLSISKKKDTDDSTVMANSIARLTFPIHARYEELNTKLPFSVLSLIRGEDAYVRRCLGSVSYNWASEKCGDGSLSTSSSSDDDHCVNIPVGLLNDLSFVYHALMTLLVIGAFIVVISIR